MKKNIIEVSNLSKTYKIIDIFEKLSGKKEKVGIKDVSFEVKEGEVFSIIGLNGVGKTTLMKCILGLTKPDSGEIRIFQKKGISKEDYYDIGYLPEISYYPKDIKLKDLINYYADLYGMDKIDKKNKIGEILKILSLDARVNQKLEKFSKGMLQKVGIAQAIMNEPKLVFLDEPMSGLDPFGRRQVMDLIKKLQKRGSTIILNTHILNDIEKVGNRVALINEGKIQKIKRIKDLAEESYYLVRIDTAYKDFYLADGIYFKNIKEDKLNNLLAEIVLRGIKVLSIEKKLMSLENFFIDEIM